MKTIALTAMLLASFAATAQDGVFGQPVYQGFPGSQRYNDIQRNSLLRQQNEIQEQQLRQQEADSYRQRMDAIEDRVNKDFDEMQRNAEDNSLLDGD